MDGEPMDYSEEPGDLDPIGPNLARDYADAEEWEKAVHFYEIWLKEYDNEENRKYRENEALRSILSGAYCDLATALMVINQWGNADRCMHLYSEALSLNDSTRDVAVHNIYILASEIIHMKVSSPWPFDTDELKTGWRLFAFQAWDSYKRGNYGPATNLYESALKKNPDSPQLMHGLALAMIACHCNSENDPQFQRALDLIMKIHEKDPDFRFSSIQVPSSIPPDFTKKKSGRCFIATAACGSEHADEVRSLQLFRDLILRNSFPGRLFIKTYQFMSPPLARIIDNNGDLQRLTLIYFIRPAARFACKILRSKTKEI